MPFRLDLLRHGDALPAGSDGDAARALSAIGRRDVARVAEEYVRRGWRPDRILASPLRRAQETARILLLHLGEGADFGTVAELDPGYGGTQLIEALRGEGGAPYVLAIGHQPLLGQLAQALTGDRGIAFPPAGAARIEFDGPMEPGAGRLVEQVLPEALD